MRYKVIYDLYCIFDDGKVYSYKSFKWLRPDIDKNGYYKITLHYENSRYRFSLHRLVAKYFIPNPFNLPQINHIDGNKGNNHWSNLEWCSALYNNKHARILGLNNISESNRKRWENPEFRNKTSAKFRNVFKDRNFKSRNNPNFRYFIEDLEKRYHIRVLLVNKYEEIPCVLAELNSRIRNKRIFISGSFSSFDTGIEEFSHALSKSLASALINSDYRIVNGIGRRFGTHLIGYANECIAKQGIKDVGKYLIIKPFVGMDKSAAKEKRRTREKVIGQCGAALFVFGETDGNAVRAASGVFEEFEIAKKQHKTIIPIAFPGMVSEVIWNEVKSNITKYPYLERYIDLLTSEQSPDAIASYIVQILDSVQEVT